MASSDQLEGFVSEQLRDPVAVARAAALERERLGAAAAEARETAFEEGRRAGYEAGLQEARAQAEGAVAALAELLAEVRSGAERRAESLEREAVELALALAEKIVAGTVQAQPERVLEVVRGALRRIVERDVVTVVVNPDDLDLVRDSIDAVAASLGGIERIDVQGDRRVGRGGALLRTQVGEIDARLKQQLERAHEVVSQELAP